MPRRMMCTLCFETAEPETVLEGSDIAEILGWLCFAIPGWLYCMWRHAVRSKICPACGGAALVRQARAAEARLGGDSPAGAAPRFHSVSGSIRWPRALQAPRDRLLHGGVGALLAVSLAIVWGAGSDAIAGVFALAASAWIGFEVLRIIRLRDPAVAAWDDSGRSLSIQVL